MRSTPRHWPPANFNSRPPRFYLTEYICNQFATAHLVIFNPQFRLVTAILLYMYVSTCNYISVQKRTCTCMVHIATAGLCQMATVYTLFVFQFFVLLYIIYFFRVHNRLSNATAQLTLYNVTVTFLFCTLTHFFLPFFFCRAFQLESRCCSSRSART